MEDFATVLENFEAEQTEAMAAVENKIITGSVIKLTAKHVVVDIGGKSEGLVPIAQGLDAAGNPKFNPGDEILVMIEHGETEEGYPKLSHEKAQRNHAWEAIEKAYNEKLTLAGKVVERVKGGVSVDLGGAVAFLPGSQVDARPGHNLDGMKGQPIEVRVIKLNRKRGNIVVSRKAILDEQTAAQRSKTLETLQEGADLTGVVKNLTDYGAFVDLGGIDGLL
ncbi:MAG TPA: S1 RNA-binding domain-containing protein, partial [Terriglobales bacterium]|nr:S1 RNA-binding domain-containing protein [Terriglobales bacterium]